jgi:uncharacterized protein YktB (UPF0637 family)
MIKKFEQFEPENNIENNFDKGIDNYMFFANLENICRMVTDILEMNHEEIDKMLTEEHDWAADHISKSKESISHVHSWLKSMKK